MISRKFLLGATCALASAFVSTSVSAAELLFNLDGLTANTFKARFVFNTSTVPSIVLSSGVRYNGIPITYTLPGGTTQITENGQFTGPTFQVLNNQGGFFFGRLAQAGNFGNGIFVYGPQLFAGTTANPVFSTGVFDLSDISRQRTTDPLQVNYRLTISQVVAAIPEPATWVMMIFGFGAIGATMRRRTRLITASPR